MIIILFDSLRTHAIPEGKIESNRELNRARKSGVYIVSPVWLRHCKAEKRRLSEELFPPSMKPNMTLSNFITSVTTTTSSTTATAATAITTARSPRLPLVSSALLNESKNSLQNKRKAELVITSKTKKEPTKFPSPPSSPPHNPISHQPNLPQHSLENLPVTSGILRAHDNISKDFKRLTDNNF